MSILYVTEPVIDKDLCIFQTITDRFIIIVFTVMQNIANRCIIFETFMIMMSTKYTNFPSDLYSNRNKNKIMF